MYIYIIPIFMYIGNLVYILACGLVYLSNIQNLLLRYGWVCVQIKYIFIKDSLTILACCHVVLTHDHPW